MLKSLGRFMCFSALSLIAGGSAFADPRIALVIGNAGYKGLAPAPFATTDAAAVSETLRGAGYDVTDVRDISQADVGKTIRDFLDKVADGGPETDAFFYFSGYGAQVDSENYLIPVDAPIRAQTDVANESFRLNDFLNELARLQSKTKIVVVDGSRDHNIPNVTKGLAITEVPAGMLVAFAAAPAAPSFEGSGPNSLYGATLVSRMRDATLEINDVFKTVRADVSMATNGQQVPWSASSLTTQFHLFPPVDQAEVDKQTQTASMRPSNRIVGKQDLASLSPDEAYRAVMELDSLKAYQWFVELYPRDQRAAEIWQLIAKRREALLWRRAATRNTKTSYWNYMKRYPNGPYIHEARERLVYIGAPVDPPVDYVPVPEPLLVGYVDEAVGVPEIYYPGVQVYPVFDPAPPVLLESPVALLAAILPAILAPAALAPVPFFDRARPRFAQGLKPAINNLHRPQNLANVNLRNGGFNKPGVKLPPSRVARAGQQPQFGGMGRNTGVMMPPRNPGLSLPQTTRQQPPFGGASAPGGLPPVPGRGSPAQPQVGQAFPGGPVATRDHRLGGANPPVVNPADRGVRLRTEAERRAGSPVVNPADRGVRGRVRPMREHVASRRGPSRPVLRHSAPRPRIHRAAPRPRVAVHRAAPRHRVVHRAPRPQMRVHRAAPRPVFRAPRPVFRAAPRRMSFGGGGRRRR